MNWLLEELKKRDYQEEWAYELAYLYHRVGLATKCVEECDDLILWFGDGPYVMKAMELKMLHAPLTPIQQKKYDMAKARQSQEDYAAGDTYSEENYSEEESYVEDGYGVEDAYPEENYNEEPYPEDDYRTEEIYTEDTYLADNAEVDNIDNYAVEENQSVSSAYRDTGSIDMSQYNTINLQKVVAESMKELFADDEDIFAEERADIVQPEDIHQENATETEASNPSVEDNTLIQEDHEELPQSEPETTEKEQPVPVHTSRVAQMVTGVSEIAPEPHTGAISKVFVPGEDARVIRQDTDMDMLRDITEESVQEEHDRLEENGENVFDEQPTLQEEIASIPVPEEEVADAVQEEEQDTQEEVFHPMTGQMNLDEVAERIHKLSDEIGENIYENVTDIVEKSEEFQKTHAELLDKLAETKDNLMEIPGSAKEKITETTGAAKNKIVETTGTAKDKIAGTTGAAKDKITGTTGAAKDKFADTAANARLVLEENIMEAKSSFEAKKNAWTEKSEEWKKNRERQKAELSELSEKYEHLFEEKNFGFKRLMKAFPDMKSRENDKTLTEFKKHFHLDKPEQK